MSIEIVDFPINSMVIFHSFLYVYQRVTCKKSDLPTIHWDLTIFNQEIWYITYDITRYGETN
jgi:hypothetical protein